MAAVVCVHQVVYLVCVVMNKMNKTIYIKDADAQVWDRAKAIARDGLSPIIVDALKEFVAKEEAARSGFERIVINYNDDGANGLPRSKAFYGQWIIPPDKPLVVTSEDEDKWQHYAVAITAKHNLVVYKKTFGREADYQWQQEYFYSFSSFEEAAANQAVRSAIIEARKRLGVPTEELDI
jgi:hypothetical protein